MAAKETPNATLQKMHRSYLECSICRGTFQEPKALKCLHTFCRGCLQWYCDAKGTTTITCPVCRQNTVLPQTGVNGLQANFFLTSLAGDIKELETKLEYNSERSCPKHKGMIPQFYCETCQKLACRKCLPKDHRKKDHQVIVASLASVKYKQALQQYFVAFKENIKMLEQDLIKVTEAKQELDSHVTGSVRKVWSRAAELIAEVKAKEKQLVAMIRRLEQVERSRLEEQEDKIREMLQPRVQLLAKAKDLANNSEVTDFIFLYPVLRHDLETLSLSFPRVTEQVILPVFQESQDRAVISLGEVVMEGSWKLCRTFDNLGSGQGKFKAARGIAAAEPDEIAVADWFNGQVVIFDTQGQFKDSIAVLASKSYKVDFNLFTL
ncbi:tripartite motif-containing protein 3-like [Patiria miniata]|uniref:Uncharacterized protein n=1 Tax=Patiria miniata TaxID=46514 RepID=A0A914AGF3_PATMI|nr:tripartite motif-containing protein 3-like [Patiria miniata]